MRTPTVIRRLGIATLLIAPLLALGATGSASAFTTQYCASVPIVQGIPPWGFHTGQPITGATGSYARGHGHINLDANTVSGILCQVDRVRHQPDRLIIMTVEQHLVYHSHHAGDVGRPREHHEDHRARQEQHRSAVPGRARRDTSTLFASYNNVRSDSVQFFFPNSSCSDHDHLYHGTQVNNQVPPL